MSTRNPPVHHAQRKLSDGHSVWSYEPQGKSIDEDHFDIVWLSVVVTVFTMVGYIIGSVR